MSLFKTAVAAAALCVLSSGLALAASVGVDTIDANSTFDNNHFTPFGTDPAAYPSHWYREKNQDWDWSHKALGAGFTITSANLHISAFDVDYTTANPYLTGERDAIYAFDGATKVFLGYLQGKTDDWGFSDFTLSANLFDDIQTGLKIYIDIDSGYEGWIVSLSKSVLTINGAANTNSPAPTPTVPVPAAGWLLIASLGGLAALRRSKKA